MRHLLFAFYIGRFAIAICSNYCQEACFQVLDSKKTNALFLHSLLFAKKKFVLLFQKNNAFLVAEMLSFYDKII
jgi:hypothetical protein